MRNAGNRDIATREAGRHMAPRLGRRPQRKCILIRASGVRCLSGPVRATLQYREMRYCLILLAVALGCFAEGPKQETIRGTLTRHLGKPALETASHAFLFLDGDESTQAVLNDKRLAGFDLEAKGHFTAPEHFLVDPIHTRALMVFKDGKAKLITYWCDTCSIRYYKPGICWCCQEETTLDLRDPNAPME